VSYQYNPYAAPQAAPPLAGGALPPGTPQPWTVGEMVSLGWARFKENWAVLIFSNLAVFVIIQVISRLLVMQVGSPTDFRTNGFHSRGYWAGLGVSSAASQVVTAYFQTGLIRIWLAVARGQSPSFGVLFTGFDRFLPMIGLTLLSGFASGIGLVCLIVPGVIVYLGLYLAPYYLVDAGMGPIRAMQASWEATRGQKGDVLLLVLAGFGLGVLGGLMCLIGIFATVPLWAVASAAAYTRMSGNGVATMYGDGAPPGPQQAYPPLPGGYGPPPGYGGPPPGYGGPSGYGPSGPPPG
jgi:uncharacterized membrane protein